jgi:fused signal recognition particle receptor
MFKFLKEKLGSIFKKAKTEEEKAEKELEKIEEEEKKIEEKLEKVEKVEKEAKEEKAGEKIEIIEEKKEELKEEIKEKKSIFQKLKAAFSSKLDQKTFNELWDELEEVLIENNVAMVVIESLRKDLEKDLIDKVSKTEIDKRLREKLRENLENLFVESYDMVEKIRKGKRPFVIVFFGINGSGKTTSIAKVANLLLKHNLSPVLAASDTFRAASIEQLEKHASRLKLEVIKHKYGADPAAVAFDAIAHAKARNIDVVLIDTAGRMHTKTDLMREMEKIVRVAKPDLKIFVGESITGNDAVEQAKAFNEAIGIDGIILTKADVDEKGGAMISISKVTGKPILYLGVGQKYDDMELFDRDKILKQIFEL